MRTSPMMSKDWRGKWGLCNNRPGDGVDCETFGLGVRVPLGCVTSALPESKRTV